MIDYIWMRRSHGCGGGGLGTYIRAILYHVAPKGFLIVPNRVCTQLLSDRFQDSTCERRHSARARAEPSFALTPSPSDTFCILRLLVNDACRVELIKKRPYARFAPSVSTDWYVLSRLKHSLDNGQGTLSEISETGSNRL